jgi:O-antigen/teichoic acid export membrane protein
MGGESAAVPQVTDPIRLPLLVARTVCILALFVPVAIAVVLSFMMATGLHSTSKSDTTIWLLSFVSLVALVSGVAVHYGVGRMFRQPFLFAVAACISFGCGVVAVQVAFVSSVVLASILPYVITMVFGIAVWVVAWPRRSEWLRWMSRNDDGPHRTSTSTWCIDVGAQCGGTGAQVKRATLGRTA